VTVDDLPKMADIGFSAAGTVSGLLHQFALRAQNEKGGNENQVVLR
jgi:hypothetical protein